eukprot:CAMPEP_0172567806 /NCGR_PEP_ID=MMETSP1067-20121228/117266_1 /TAXON_ID=265564 ORGANISM="Thalassiosira punctigera, Strain Tpunct2005C2" /NCGR_SAMPLE_ID=MMETSP1067 /ASSEMBLY_ACC=CAM_ASM_000444 /LENGTH=40 /DNA_ID= /DNA_START= /DNA_END= /DNA_ORIENTATION=
MSLIDEAVALIAAAKDIEQRAKQKQRPSWAELEKSANKYH